MNRNLFSSSLKKGLAFGIVMILLVLIDFEAMSATMLSKLLGVNVIRGALPQVRFMVIFLVLYGMFVGWLTSSNEEKPAKKLVQALIAGLSVGIVVGLFDLVLIQLINTGTDVRTYLAALGPDSIKLFILEKGALSPLLHLGLFTSASLLGSALKILLKSKPVSGFFKSISTGYRSLQVKAQKHTPDWVKKYGKYLLFLLIGLSAFFLPRIWGSYNNYVVGLVGLYVILGIGLNIIVGLSGQLMLGFAAFFAMGAYSVALLNAPFPHGIMLGFWPSLLIGVLMAVLAAVLLGLPVMGMRGDYLAIVTLGFGEIIRILLKSDLLTAFTGGPRGIQDIKGPTLFGQPFSSDVDYTYIILVFMILAIFLYKRLERSRTGRAWLAIKEDTKVAQATGINIQNNKLLALCLGAAFAGLAGGIFAARNQFTGPNDHQLMVSMNILSILIVGGMNSIPGIILGAFTLKGLPEILREIENYRLLVFGGLLVLMMLSRPEGLWPSTRPDIEKDEGNKLKGDTEPGKGGPID